MIPLFKPYVNGEELLEIKEVLESRWLAQGIKVKLFESSIAAMLGVKHVVACSSCTAALHLALSALGMENDDVLISDYTFPATGHAVCFTHARPIFVDIQPDTYNISLADAKKKLTTLTSAIIPVHTFGQAADMDGIMEFAKNNTLYVIEDAACAFGSKYKDHYVGTIGHVGCFSFHATKGITTGEGGCVVTNDDEIATKVRSLLTFGSQIHASWERAQSNQFIIPSFDSVGFNYKMSDIAAACGIAQLRKLDRIIKKKRQLADYWTQKLDDVSYITAPYVHDYNYHNYQGYCTLVDRRVDRDGLIQYLKDRGIGTQIGTYASHIQPAYGNHYFECPVSLDVYQRALRLPLYYELAKDQIDHIINVLQGACGEDIIIRDGV